MLIADSGGGYAGPGSVPLVVRPEKLREASERVAQVADRLESRVSARLLRTRIDPAGADAVSLNAAEFSNNQINGGAGSGYWAVSGLVENLRQSAETLAAAAADYEAQEANNADAFPSA